MTMHSATLAINEALQAKKQIGERVIHLGFGEAGLPVPADVLNVMRTAAPHNSYSPVAGSDEVRESAAGWFTRRGYSTNSQQVVFAPGSKALLFALLQVLEGDLILPTPSWVSYAAQADIVKKNVVRVRAPRECGGVPDPELLVPALDAHIAAGGSPGILLLTIPDNPTGTVATPELVARLCTIARDYDLTVISDEIYREVVHDGQAPSALQYAPERTIVTSGLSKSMSLGGWRIGFARVPDNEPGAQLMSGLIGVASEIWSSMPAPMHDVAAYVLSDPQAVTDHIELARTLHSRVANAVFDIFTGAGATGRKPTAAFYLYPDFGPVAANLAQKGIETSPAMADWLLREHNVGILPGSAFGDDEQGLRARVATSLLYGDTDEQRWEALRSDSPTALPWIADALEALAESLADMTQVR